MVSQSLDAENNIFYSKEISEINKGSNQYRDTTSCILPIMIKWWNGPEILHMNIKKNKQVLPRVHLDAEPLA